MEAFSERNVISDVLPTLTMEVRIGIDSQSAYVLAVNSTAKRTRHIAMAFLNRTQQMLSRRHSTNEDCASIQLDRCARLASRGACCGKYTSGATRLSRRLTDKTGNTCRLIETEVECEQAVPRKDATVAGSVLHHLHCAIDLQRLKTMTKREAAQGVNARLNVALDQDSVAPGEIIRGVGREWLAWDEGGYSPVTNAFDKIFLQHQIELSPSAVFKAGESELSSVSYQRTCPRALSYLTSTAKQQNVPGADQVSAEEDFTVHDPSTSAPPARALKILTSEVVHWLYCVKRGDLQMTVTIPNDVSVSGQAVPLQCCVDTYACKVSVKSI
uniref:Uncharacterized protein n=1 Tax=Hyaloperonospora arabidopsidis (strain Emoy2) TaxID=559515 RepID=M4BC56_HYAAE